MSDDVKVYDIPGGFVATDRPDLLEAIQKIQRGDYYAVTCIDGKTILHTPSGDTEIPPSSKPVDWITMTASISAEPWSRLEQQRPPAAEGERKEET